MNNIHEKQLNLSGLGSIYMIFTLIVGLMFTLMLFFGKPTEQDSTQ